MDSIPLRHRTRRSGGRLKADTADAYSSPPYPPRQAGRRLKKRVVQKADGRYLIYYERGLTVRGLAS
jgi:hypothetical protein